MSRIAIILLFVPLLLVTGSLLAIAFILRDPLPVLSPQSPITLADEDGELSIMARLQVNPRGDFLLVFAIEGVAEDPPQLSLRMPDHDMPPMNPVVATIDGGRFTATGSFTMPGRWELSLQHAGRSQSLRFIVRE